MGAEVGIPSGIASLNASSNNTREVFAIEVSRNLNQQAQIHRVVISNESYGFGNTNTEWVILKYHGQTFGEIWSLV